MKRTVLIILVALAVIAGGYLYLRMATDQTADTTLRISGNIEGPYGSAAFVQAQGIATDPAGNIYLADEFALNIRKLSNGQVSLLAGGAGSVIDGTGASAGFGGPHGIAYNPVDGALYVADSGARNVRV